MVMVIVGNEGGCGIVVMVVVVVGIKNIVAEYRRKKTEVSHYSASVLLIYFSQSPCKLSHPITPPVILRALTPRAVCGLPCCDPANLSLGSRIL